jgi:hypothetical protein
MAEVPGDTPKVTTMSQTTFEQDISRNRDAFASLRDEIRRRQAGQYVALADGKLQAAAPSYDEALAALQRLPSMPKCYFIFEADDEPIFDVFTDY